jgi:hypothetical protein
LEDSDQEEEEEEVMEECKISNAVEENRKMKEEMKEAQREIARL